MTPAKKISNDIHTVQKIIDGHLYYSITTVTVNSTLTSGGVLPEPDAL